MSERVLAPLLLKGINVYPMISIYMHSKMWDKITYIFPNINGASVEVSEWDVFYMCTHEPVLLWDFLQRNGKIHIRKYNDFTPRAPFY